MSSKRKTSLNQVCETLPGLETPDLYLSNLNYAKLSRHFGKTLIGVILFGSRARKTTRAGSDTDLLFVFEDKINIERKIYTEIDSIITNEKSATSIHCAHLPDITGDIGSLWLEIALDGIILRDPYDRLGGLILEIRKQITAGLYKRETSHGHGYWINCAK